MNENVLKIAKGVTAALLLLAIADLPYGYYTFLRVTVFVVSIFCVFEYYEKKDIFVIIFSLVAILFNPIFPVHLDKATWTPIDIITSLIFIISIFVKADEEKSELQQRD